VSKRPLPPDHPSRKRQQASDKKSGPVQNVRPPVTVPTDRPSPFQPKPPVTGGQQTRDVLGPDDRRAVFNTANRPACSVCALLITFPQPRVQGEVVCGTGALIGRRTLATAGHNLFDHSRGGFATEVRVFPGRTVINDNGLRVVNPFREQAIGSTSFKILSEWQNSASPNHDCGLVVLPAPFVHSGDGLQADPVRYAAPPDDQLIGQPSFVVGYSLAHPQTQEGNQIAAAGLDLLPVMWSNRNNIIDATSRKLSYLMDTDGGTSGAPVLLPSGGEHFLVAIHTEGNGTHNSGVRIHDELFGWFNQVRQEINDVT
jgi:glutamyl endopeptidase